MLQHYLLYFLPLVRKGPIVLGDLRRINRSDFLNFVHFSDKKYVQTRQKAGVSDCVHVIFEVNLSIVNE
jgi:hypothetical protein